MSIIQAERPGHEISTTAIAGVSTLFGEKQSALDLARKLNSDDDDNWTYTAERFGYAWAVATYDENVKFVGYL
jgi:hypothetical protein